MPDLLFMLILDWQLGFRRFNKKMRKRPGTEWKQDNDSISRACVTTGEKAFVHMSVDYMRKHQYWVFVCLRIRFNKFYFMLIQIELSHSYYFKHNNEQHYAHPVQETMNHLNAFANMQTYLCSFCHSMLKFCLCGCIFLHIWFIGLGGFLDLQSSLQTHKTKFMYVVFYTFRLIHS